MTDAAAALASVINAEDLRVFTTSNALAEVPARRGMAGVDAVINSQPHGGTELGEAVHMIAHGRPNFRAIPHDRLIVITDEQANGGQSYFGYGTRSTPVPDPVAKNSYMINVTSAKNGVGYGKWIHIDGFSESVIRYIHEIENQD